MHTTLNNYFLAHCIHVFRPQELYMNVCHGPQELLYSSKHNMDMNPTSSDVARGVHVGSFAPMRQCTHHSPMHNVVLLLTYMYSLSQYACSLHCHN